MSWLRGSPFPFGRQLSRALDQRIDYDPSACFQTFCKHWQQALHIINSTQGTESAQQDAVLGVVSHVEQTATLLVLEARAHDLRGSGASPAPPPACLYHLLSENLLRSLYDWSLNTGRYMNAVCVEQLKLYSMLLSCYGQHAHTVEPLLRLLHACCEKLLPQSVRCCLSRYMNAVRVEQLKLYSVLLSCYGQQALAAEPLLRPLLRLLHACCGELLPQPVEGELVALLGQLCVVLMQNLHLVDLFFISNSSNTPREEFVPVRLLLGSVHGEGAAGAGARDALLLCANMSARHGRLAAYLHSHSDACVLLATGLSGLYSLLPRTLAASYLPPDRARLGADHVAAVPKLSLFIDSLEFCDAVAQVSPPQIRRQLLDFFYQGFLVPVMGPALLQSGLAEQTTAVAYLELCVRCASARGLLRPLLRFLLLYSYDDVRLLDVLLAPRRLHADTQLSVVSLGLLETLVELNCEDVLLELVYRHLLSTAAAVHTHREETLECEAYREGAAAFLALAPACCAHRPVAASTRARALAHAHDAHSGDIALDILVTDTSLYYANPHESLLGNYHAYLCDARQALETRALACSRWTSLYPLSLHAQHGTESAPALREQEHDSLTSLGESSGYDSFRCRHDDHDDSDDAFAEDAFWSDASLAPPTTPAPRLVSMCQHKQEMVAGGGPLLAVLLQKASRLLQFELHTAALITGLLSKLAAFPTPALSTLLLCPSVPYLHSPSLYQVLSDLKREADEVTRSCSDAPALVERARVFLVRRELAHARRRLPAPHNNNENSTDDAEAAARRVSGGAVAAESGGGVKRRSFSSSLSHMLARRLSGIASPPAAATLPQARVHSGDGGESDGAFWSTSASRRALLNTVLLDEWLKELSALAHQHALRSAAPLSAPLGL